MPYNLKTAEDILRAIKDDKIQIIDLRFTDLPGLWRKYSVPPSAFNPQSCEIQNGSMLIPDPASAFLDPFSEMPTLVLICNIRDALTGKTFAHDFALHRAEGGGLFTEDADRRHRKFRSTIRALHVER